MLNAPKKPLLAVIAILLFTAGCEFVGFVVSQEWKHRECGQFDEPPELMEKLPKLGSEGRFNDAIVLLEKYEYTRNPNVLFLLGYLYSGKVADSPDDPARDRRIIDLLTVSALCGQEGAVLLLSGIYNLGLVGVEKDPERGACLKKIYERHRYERSLIPGRVWACGLRIESVRQ